MKNGDLHVLAALSGTVDFGGALAASSGIAVAKLDSGGQHVWSRQFGDGMSVVHHQIAVDVQGNAVLTGSFDGTLDFGNGPIGSSDGAVEEAFVAKLDPTGTRSGADTSAAPERSSDGISTQIPGATSSFSADSRARSISETARSPPRCAMSSF
ncbi:hypothetical protein [Sorangium sp. So ce128]|uniref:hypothetical protein n=1 Tax=Sorangium sp. So ce128 TaxID=3133281 RepID=UPI003F5D6250